MGNLRLATLNAEHFGEANGVGGSVLRQHGIPFGNGVGVGVVYAAANRAYVK